MTPESTTPASRREHKSFLQCDVSQCPLNGLVGQSELYTEIGFPTTGTVGGITVESC